MPKARAPYPSKFRQKLVELVRAGRTAKELAQEFESSEQTIRNWQPSVHRPQNRSTVHGGNA